MKKRYASRLSHWIELKKVETRYNKSILDKTVKILEELAKNDEEYKILLKRKRAGESVEDLITQNRNHEKILKKKDKENVKEAKRWEHSKEGRMWIEESLMKELLIS